MTELAETRSFTATWSDPQALAEKARSMRGIDFLRAMTQGQLPPPPIASVLGFRIAEVKEGEVVFELVPSERLYNPIGVVHGGIAATLLDSAMGCSVHSQLPLGDAYTTLEMKVNLVRAVTLQSGVLRATGRVIHSGRSTATAEGRLEDASGKLYAHASTTCQIMRGALR
jgi:uncharacterized protein (TIGR00369 family)